jgi:hypothetical protein
MKRRFTSWLLSMLLGTTLINCAGSTMDRLETQPRFPPKAAFAEFTIVSMLSPAELTAILERLFQQHPLLRDALSCSRYGAGNVSLDCRKVIREDVFAANLEAGKKTLMLSLVPRTIDVEYKPDYGHFKDLRDQIARLLTSHFGEGNIILK